MYYGPHSHTVIAELMAVDICKYKMWAFAIKSTCMLNRTYTAWAIIIASLHIISMHYMYTTTWAKWIQCDMCKLEGFGPTKCPGSQVVWLWGIVWDCGTCMYYMLLIYHGKGEQLLLIAKNKLSIKSNLTFSTHVMLAGSPLSSTLESLGRMDTIHQVVGWTLLTKRPELTCLLCKHATTTKSAFVKTVIIVLFYSI